MNFKKTIALVICLIMMISCMTVAASAATASAASISISASSTEVKAGETVTFTVYLNATNIYSYDCKISLPAGMELVGSVTANSISSNFFAPTASGLRVYSTGYNAGAAGGEGFTGSGAIATFTCKVNSEGTVSASVAATGEKYSEKLDQNVNYDFTGNSGSVTVKIACSHDYKAAVTDPTCTAQGYTTYTCSLCGNSYKDDYKDALGHTSKKVDGYDATCTEDGLTDGAVCSVCGETITAQTTIPAKGHTEATKQVDVVDATCKKPGSYVEVTYCSVCNVELGRKEVTGQTLPHTEETIPGKAATCTATGLTDGKKCSVCGEILEAQKEIPVADHSWKDATCTAAKTCKVCGATEGNALGHKFDKIECSGKWGKHSIKCSVCGEYNVKDEACFDTHPADGKCDVCDCEKPAEPTTKPTDKDDKDDVPKTGDITPYTTYMLIALMAVVATAFGLKRKFDV